MNIFCIFPTPLKLLGTCIGISINLKKNNILNLLYVLLFGGGGGGEDEEDEDPSYALHGKHLGKLKGAFRRRLALNGGTDHEKGREGPRDGGPRVEGGSVTHF